MIFDLIRGHFSAEDLMILLLSIPVILIALSFHESAHGWMAERLGDKTARWNGRITMNPVRHFDPIGMLSMLFLGIGWAKPVPINPRNFENPKKGMAITGLAGPVSNLILGFGGMLVLRIAEEAFAAIGPVSQEVYFLMTLVATFFSLFATINVSLAVFNLIPVPPFDGSRIFYFLLPDRLYFSVMRYERVIMMIVILAAFSGLLSVPLSWASGKILQLFDFIIGLVPFL